MSTRHILPGFAALALVALLAAQCASPAPPPAASTEPTEAPTEATEAPTITPVPAPPGPHGEAGAGQVQAKAPAGASAVGPLSGTERVLRYPINTDPQHLDPFRSTDISARRILVNIFEGLTTLDQDTAYVKPGLAETWTISQNGLVYTFHLKKGVTFQQVTGVTYSSSRQVTARDWVWSWKTFLSGSAGVSSQPEYLEAVKGAGDFTAGKTEEVEGLKILDDYTLEVTLTRPDHRFLFNLAKAYVVPREAYEQLGREWADRPVGTGPFILKEWEREDHITLVRNPEYHEAGVPYLDEVRFIYVPQAATELQLYRGGEIDLLLNFPLRQVGSIREEFPKEYVEKPGLHVSYYGFNLTQSPFKDNPDLRKAFNFATNMTEIWKGLMEGARQPGEQGVLPPVMPAADVEGYRYNLKKAREYLVKAGYPDGRGLGEIGLYYPASAPDMPQKAVQAQLAAVGIRVQLKKEDDSIYWDHIGKDDVKLFLSGWSAEFNDPSEIFDSLFYQGRDDTGYNNPKVNELIARASATLNDDERVNLYKEIHQIIMDDCPWIVSSYGKIIYLRKPWVKDFIVPPAGAHWATLKYVKVER